MGLAPISKRMVPAYRVAKNSASPLQVPFKKPEILVLDEATSSLDSGSETCVLKTLHPLRYQNKTIILIAHPLSTVVNAGTIVVLDEGKVVHLGSHEGLYAKKGLYSSCGNSNYHGLPIKLNQRVKF
ncbi:MAG: hypothetical protein AAGH81_18940 [Bacteroidota bacterium]